jgi:5'(3')-deoxyribonucleotidase
MERKHDKLVVVDIDGVLADFVGAICAFLNSRQGKYKYTVEDFTDYEICNCLKKGDRLHFDMAPFNPNFVYNIRRYDGAQDFIRELSKFFDIILITAPWKGPYHTQARQEWVESFLSPKWAKNIDFQWVTADERVYMPGDLLIEDNLVTALKWSKLGKKAIVFDRPWNRGPIYGEHKTLSRGTNYRDILDLAIGWLK